jgi:hypothetical protein
MFPIVIANNCCFETNGIVDGAEAEVDHAGLKEKI